MTLLMYLSLNKRQHQVLMQTLSVETLGKLALQPQEERRQATEISYLSDLKILSKSENKICDCNDTTQK